MICKQQIVKILIPAIVAAGLCACRTAGTSAEKTAEPTMETTAESGINYMALVNKLNKLPDNWEEQLETVHMTNSMDGDVEVETKAYDAYLKLKEDLEKEGVYVDLDNARRSVETQQKIMDDFTKEYGADYAAKIVAEPGYSEHHTGLALDLYLIIDGKDVYLNEDMMQYPEIWSKIHAKLADYGFILRYLDGKEHITGYAYEPWHIRYIDDVDIAKKIMESGQTLEEYLGTAKSTELTVDLGTSYLFTEEELTEAMIQVKCKFAAFDGCELSRLSYAGDVCNTAENLEWISSMDENNEYVKVAEFLTDFHVSDDSKTTFNPGQDYKDYQWWLGYTKDGSWQLVSWGY